MMICPCCSVFFDEGNVCPICGTLAPDENKEEQNFPILGRIEGLSGGVELWPYTVCIWKGQSQAGGRRVIALQDICQIGYRPAKQGKDGFLVIRDSMKKQKMPLTTKDAELDENAVIFGQEMNEQFDKIHMYLQTHSLKAQTDISTQIQAKGKCCPKCKSRNYRVQRNDFNLPHRQEKNLLLVLMRLMLCIYYALRKEPHTHICDNCGHEWTAW